LLIYSNYSDIISRNGGEEFSVLMKNCPQVEALETAERIEVQFRNTSFY